MTPPANKTVRELLKVTSGYFEEIDPAGYLDRSGGVEPGTFGFGDWVRVREDAPAACRPGTAGEVVGVAESPHGYAHRYAVEFPDGGEVEVTEDQLELLEPAAGAEQEGETPW